MQNKMHFIKKNDAKNQKETILHLILSLKTIHRDAKQQVANPSFSITERCLILVLIYAIFQR